MDKFFIFMLLTMFFGLFHDLNFFFRRNVHSKKSFYPVIKIFLFFFYLTVYSFFGFSIYEYFQTKFAGFCIFSTIIIYASVLCANRWTGEKFNQFDFSILIGCLLLVFLLIYSLITGKGLIF